MPIYEPFCKRQQRERGEFPTTFQTDNIPDKLRGQAILILRNYLGETGQHNLGEIYAAIVEVISEELGIHDVNHKYLLDVWFSPKGDDKIFLSVIELSIRMRRGLIKDNFGNDDGFNFYYSTKGTTEEMIDDLNTRFKENGYGYQIENDTLIPIDDAYTHSEAVKPAIVLMVDEGFKGSLSEFMQAFEAYKSGNFKECLRECSNSIESVLKQIFDENVWTLPKKHQAAQLFEEALKYKLFPSYMLAHFSALASTVRDGVPTIRNNAAGHGGGTEIIEVDDFMARYVINL
ncbi:hypothetical protein MF271_00925 (plasmid) [Deinococcus sp. KNUC1210]|uniref:STM4504/CBY_0614 family protein n=1 Tax=Deinococcus sp. KNUC1210 TaxID=2917691 RepID=UPI001EF114CD|nr:hypothetical protein [Deinococcus sp. KNUC1210]ULH13925.1 hypothetical protein MF271_00925 [Deinococcus sp. KNUC1210]